ncbi:hypothetical protein E4N77_09100 [Treponema denticola]|nr:hypothetical protein E4N77_09100 [Treponema denticola]
MLPIFHLSFRLLQNFYIVLRIKNNASMKTITLFPICFSNNIINRGSPK